MFDAHVVWKIAVPTVPQIQKQIFHWIQGEIPPKRFCFGECILSREGVQLVWSHYRLIVIRIGFIFTKLFPESTFFLRFFLSL